MDLRTRHAGGAGEALLDGNVVEVRLRETSPGLLRGDT